MLAGMIKAVRYPRRAARFAFRKAREALFWDSCYQAVREPKRLGAIPHDAAIEAAVAEELRRNGFDLRDFTVDHADFRRYVAAAGYSRSRTYYDGGRAPGFVEKALEHYLAAHWLALKPGDTYVDVASYDSPAPGIYGRLYGCNAYHQDLIYPAGLRGHRIGGDAGHMPVPDGFANGMALHNAFEHFEGDADTRFIREAGRVLASGGRLCIAPLFLFESYAIQCDPILLRDGGAAFEPEAVIYCARGWHNRHGRIYDVPHLISRIRDHLGPLRMLVYNVTNARELDPACYLRFALVLEKL